MRIFIYFLLILITVSCKQKELNEKSVLTKENVEIVNSQGLLETNELTFNAGKIKKGTPIKHTFNFKNTGTEPVIIIEKTMSCNCTNLKSSNDTIAPQQNTSLEATIDTKDKDPGYGEATITVKTNGKRKFFLLAINFEIIN
ncbi:DUF1573 domain-containing protein [Flavobacterium sp.]|uniref:DUF1573 domain-containing protein n=1 Tax=Flavobacterium sp. TaxID=239 RepID=UPI000EC13CB0|nr:DUF1573 domain-containing protein [Flavobacterium sp.]HCQ14532.1 hypothetical protein [Flavobacterium sp.]